MRRTASNVSVLTMAVVRASFRPEPNGPRSNISAGLARRMAIAFISSVTKYSAELPQLHDGTMPDILHVGRSAHEPIWLRKNEFLLDHREAKGLIKVTLISRSVSSQAIAFNVSMRWQHSIIKHRPMPRRRYAGNTANGPICQCDSRGSCRSQAESQR